jgi:hypothetical protein
VRRARTDFRGARGPGMAPLLKPGGLLQPRRKEAFDLLAPARPLKACAYRLAFDHDKGRQQADAEPLKEIGALLLFDAVQLERAVVAVVLEHLREERLSAPTCTFGLGVEKHDPRLLRGNDRVSQLSRPYRSNVAFPAEERMIRSRAARSGGARSQSLRPLSRPRVSMPENGRQHFYIRAAERRSGRAKVTAVCSARTRISSARRKQQSAGRG